MKKKTHTSSWTYTTIAFPKIKRYCTHCGREMLPLPQNVHYNQETGKRQAGWWNWRCSSKRWRWDKHSQFKSDIDGSTYAFEV